MECGRSWVRTPVVSNQSIMLALVAPSLIIKHASLVSKSKDLLARNHDNVSEWIDVSTRDLLFQFHYEKSSFFFSL